MASVSVKTPAGADAGTVEPRARESLGMKTPEKTVILVVEP